MLRNVAEYYVCNPSSCFFNHLIFGLGFDHFFIGMTTYDNDNMKVTVTTCEISREEEILPRDKTEAAVPRPAGADKHTVPVTKKKAFKRVARTKSRSKPQNKRDKKKGKNKNKKMR